MCVLLPHFLLSDRKSSGHGEHSQANAATVGVSGPALRVYVTVLFGFSFSFVLQLCLAFSRRAAEPRAWAQVALGASATSANSVLLATVTSAARIA